MPPRTRRETPARRDARIHKHLAQAKEYWINAPRELSRGDICQSGEKGWGAVAQLTKAVAALRGWDHYDHEAIREAITALAGELPEQAQPIYRGMRAAEALHGNFYEVYMTLDLARFDLSEVRPLLQVLWGLLPDEYTGGASFAEWFEAGE